MKSSREGSVGGAEPAQGAQHGREKNTKRTEPRGGGKERKRGKKNPNGTKNEKCKRSLVSILARSSRQSGSTRDVGQEAEPGGAQEFAPSCRLGRGLRCGSPLVSVPAGGGPWRPGCAEAPPAPVGRVGPGLPAGAAGGELCRLPWAWPGPFLCRLALL